MLVCRKAVETITEDPFPEQEAVSQGHSGGRWVLWIPQARQDP